MMSENAYRYPVGSQSFQRIREDGYLYVDKTDLVYRMTHENSDYIFLSRPRRFGKSLLVSTLKSYFEGRRDLFKGLAIEGMETEWAEYPVLLFSFASIKDVSAENLKVHLMNQINNHARWQGLDVEGNSINVRFTNLVLRTFEKTGKQVVILIDEYDTPILETIHDAETLPRIRTIMRDFHAPLKDLAPCLRFVFLTGITRISTLSSDLNVVKNISMLDRYASICGFTEEEMLDHLGPGIERLAAKLGCTFEEAVGELRSTYDGYHFTWPSPDLYNPFSLLMALREKATGHYWFSTGSSAYLVGMLRKLKVDPKEIRNHLVGPSTLTAPIDGSMSAVPLLYQSGYLTIKGYRKDEPECLLDYPNGEVREGLALCLLSECVGSDMSETDAAGQSPRS